MGKKVSVIMSTFNDAAFLAEALDSVLTQSFNNFELLVVNDGSTDNTEEILINYQSRDSRVIFWSNKISQGLTANLNSMLDKAAGEFIARIDSDDVWLVKDKLEKQLVFLGAHKDCCIVGTWAEVCDAAGQKLYDLKYPASDANVRTQILRHNCFVHSSVLVRKENILRVGGYDPAKKYIEDYALWLKLGKAAGFANLPEILVRYRSRVGSITQSRNLEQIREILALIAQYKNSYPGYLKAKLKWSAQYFFTSIFGSKNLLRLRQML